jgi:hypothetical protein
MSSSKPQKPDKNKTAEPLPLEEGDYYFNAQGLMVFTAQYHLKRGYCCGNKCKHCPYGWENVKQRELGN